MENEYSEGRADDKQLILTGENFINFPVKVAAKRMVETIAEQSNRPLEAIAVLKRIQEVTKMALEDAELKQLLLKETLAYGGTAHFGNADLKAGTTHTKYDYTLCNHLEYNSLIRVVEEAQARMKKIEEKLKTVTKAEPETVYPFIWKLYQVESGEVSTIYPPGVKKTEGVFITLK